MKVRDAGTVRGVVLLCYVEQVMRLKSLSGSKKGV